MVSFSGKYSTTDTVLALNEQGPSLESETFIRPSMSRRQEVRAANGIALITSIGVSHAICQLLICQSPIYQLPTV
jgi:hypothetical protein